MAWGFARDISLPEVINRLALKLELISEILAICRKMGKKKGFKENFTSKRGVFAQDIK